MVRNVAASEVNRSGAFQAHRYKPIVERFVEFLGAKSKRDLSTLQASDIARFRDHEAKERSRSTANLSVKVLRVCLGEAVRQGLLTVNPGARGSS